MLYQQHKIASISMFILTVLWILVGLIVIFLNLGQLQNFTLRSKEAYKLWREEHEATNEDLFQQFEKQIIRYKILTRIYGNYFTLPEAVIDEAIEDERLWNNVKNVFETDPYSYSSANFADSLNIAFSSKVNDERESSDARNIDEFVSHTRATRKTQTELEANFETLDVDITEKSTLAYSKLFPVDTKKLEILFENLTGYTVNAYLEKKTPYFKLTGNLNLWKYFFNQWSTIDFANLKRSTTLECNSDEGNHVVVVSDSNPVRTSSDNKYLLYDRLISGPKFIKASQESKVTVTTQMSMDRLHTFVQSYKYWNGPISLAVLLDGPMEYFVLRSYLSFMKRCYPRQFEITCVSIATPFEDPIPRDVFIQTTDFDKTNCSMKNSAINEIQKKRLTKSSKWLKTKWYPQNMMRNLARVNIITDYHITLDVDIIPCPKMSEKLTRFLSIGHKYTNALVIPTYEISRKVEFPKTKSELISLTKKRQAQPFHRDVYLPNQNATNFPKWEKIHDTFEEIHVVHEVHQFPIHYEPFFVELNSSPMYDEGFVGYGFTRSSHAYEIFLKNGNFLILSPIFTAQLGIQKAKEWSDTRQQQNEHNRLRFEIFVKNLTSLYLHESNTKESTTDSSRIKILYPKN